MTERADLGHSGREIRDEICIDAPPEVVWRAWADPEIVPAWFVDRAEGRMEVGETVHWYWGSTGEGMTHEVLVADPPRRLVLGMDVPMGATLIEITIEQEGGQSVVRFVQSGFGEGAEWDEHYEGMLSGWLVAMALLKHFAERYFGRRRTEIMVLRDAQFDREELLDLQRSEGGLQRWLTQSGAPGKEVGQPVRIVFEDGTTLTGTVLRQTRYETLWSWEEVEGVLEIKAFRGPHWGSQVGVRVMSWLEDVSKLGEVEGMLSQVVGKLAALLA